MLSLKHLLLHPILLLLQPVPGILLLRTLLQQLMLLLLLQAYGVWSKHPLLHSRRAVDFPDSDWKVRPPLEPKKKDFNFPRRMLAIQRLTLLRKFEPRRRKYAPASRARCARLPGDAALML